MSRMSGPRLGAVTLGPPAFLALVAFILGVWTADVPLSEKWTHTGLILLLAVIVVGLVVAAWTDSGDPEGME